MIPIVRLAGALLLLGLAAPVGAPTRAVAQEGVPFSLPAGSVRFRVGLQYSHFGSRFANGGREPLAAPLRQPLTAGAFAPVGVLQDRLNRFFEATDAGGEPVRAGPDNLSLGTPDVELSGDVRSVPLALEVGVLPRVRVSVEMPVFRTHLGVERFGATGATVGLNPDRVGNAAVLGALGPGFSELGAGPILPTDSSALGRALQARVRAMGRELDLPAAIPDSLAAERDAAFAQTLNALLASEFGVAPLQAVRSEWELGDAVVGLGVRVLGNMGDAPFPADSAGLRYQLFATGSARLPTGTEPAVGSPWVERPEVGLGGWGAGVRGELFAGERFWLSGAAEWSTRREAEVERRLVPAASPLASALPPQRVRWSPGSTAHVWVAPRFRLTEAIAIAGVYEALRRGEASYRLVEGGEGDASVLARGGGLVQRVGGSIHYSTVPAFVAGAALLPVDVSLAYRSAVAGPEGALVESTIQALLSIQYPLWGR